MEALLTLIVIILSTFIVGSFAGYLLHLLMHTRFSKLPTMRRVSKSHNVHHSLYTIRDSGPYSFESEEYRSAGRDDSAFVFVPAITLAIGLMCLAFWFVFQAWWIYPIILAVGTSIGWLNGKLHECFHIKDHWLNKYKLFREWKRLHWLHHKYPKMNHGIIWFIPDKVFGTFRKD
jgi:hypothetical protein